jgi:pimeloyl-ACP methyl ester carboxylesterase
MSLVLLPGFMLDADLWRDVEPALARLGPILHGDLFQDGTIGDMARRVLAAAPPRFVLVGFSMGGYVAREIARLAPARVAALVLVATSARADSDAQKARREAIAQRPAETAFRGLSRTALAAALHPDRAGDAALVERLRAMGDRLGPAVFARQSGLRRDAPDTRLAGIACPTLVIAAGQDRLRSLAEAEELRAGIPGAVLRVVQDSGHMIPIEAPEALARLILDWLPGQAET